MVDKQLLEKFVVGLATDEEVEVCESFLKNSDEDSVHNCLLDTEIEGDSLLNSLGKAADDRMGPPDDAAEMKQVAERINHRIQQQLDSAEFLRYLNPAESADELGRIGPYRILEKIGAGGMGIVFKAEHAASGDRVALKLLNPLLATSSSATERFRRESKAVSKLDHLHVVKILEVGNDSGLPYFTMPLLRGQTLGSLLKSAGKLPWQRVRALLLQVLDGLRHAHEAGILHRDLKPENLWLDEQDRLVILDFGLARGATDSQDLTKTGDLLGTPRYMAPEQVQGQKLDRRADLFSLGAVAYEMLTGVSKFADENIFSTMMAVTQSAVQVDELVEADCPRPLAVLICQLLEKIPADRPDSVAEVQVQLEEMEHLATGPMIPQVQAKRRLNLLTFVSGFVAGAALVACAIIVYLKTDRGTLVLTADDGVALSSEQDQLTIRLIDSSQEYTVGLGENKLPSGAYEIVVSDVDSGTTFSAEHFVIRRGGKRMLEVAHENHGAGAADGIAQAPLNSASQSVGEMATRRKLLAVHKVCQQYRSTVGGWPNNLETLVECPSGMPQRMWKGPYLIDSDPLLDAWGTRLQYQTPTADRAIIISCGPDKEFGTEDDLFSDPAAAAQFQRQSQHGTFQVMVGPSLEHLEPVSISEALRLDSPDNNALYSLGPVDRLGNFRDSVLHRSRIRDLSLNFDESMLAAGGDDAVVRIWPWAKVVETGGDGLLSPLHLLPCRYPVRRVCWSPMANLLAVATVDPAAEQGQLLLWRVSQGECELVYQTQQVCEEICFAPDGARMGVQTESGIRILDLRHLEPRLLPNYGLNGTLTKKAWSPDGTHLVVNKRAGLSADESPSTVQMAVVWDIEKAAVVQQIPHARDAGYVIENGQPQIVALVEKTGGTTVKTWEIDSYTPVSEAELSAEAFFHAA